MPPNFATVEKVKEGFTAASSRMDTIEKDYSLAIKELSETLKNLKQTLGSYGRSVLMQASELAITRASGAMSQWQKSSGHWLCPLPE